MGSNLPLKKKKIAVVQSTLFSVSFAAEVAASCAVKLNERHVCCQKCT